MFYNYNLSRRKRYFYWLAVLSCVLCYVYYYCDRKVKASQPFDLPYVVVHLDFKGSPPKLSYLTSILGLLREHGANGLMLEYEDMFPFDAPLQHLRASNAYSRDELEEFVAKAVEMGFEIIPLVQTFGHMEYVLKHDQYKTLRENIDLTDSICPSQSQSQELVRGILAQIINFHSKISPLQLIHIGCDEVYTINSCQYCKQRNTTNLNIFREHVQFAYDYVKLLTPGTEVLIWNDMLLSERQEELHNPVRLPLDLVSWDYRRNVTVSFIDLFIQKKDFSGIWVASAFKGADGKESLLPDLVERFQNHFSWMQFLEKYSRLLGQPKPDFRGIILTGWSRYNHNAPVCDMLPAALPSLILNLMLIKKFNTQLLYDVPSMTWSQFYDHEINEDTVKALDCIKGSKAIYNIDGDNCRFQGSDLNSALNSFRYFLRSIEGIETELKLESSNFNKNQERLIHEIENLKRKLDDKLVNILRKAMSPYFDDFVIASYLKQIIASSQTLFSNVRHQLKLHENKSFVL